MSAREMERQHETQTKETTMHDGRKFYKVFTHDLRSPIRGGAPVWDGSLPYALPAVALDTSAEECAAGWNFCADAATALRISGYWPNGHSSRLMQVTPGVDMIERGDKWRSSVLTIEREVPEREIAEHIGKQSVEWFKDLAAEMLLEQMAWRWAMGAGFDKQSAKNVRTRARDAWDARDARSARSVWSVWDVWSAWSTRDVWDARDAWDALTIYYVCVLRQWHALPPSYKWLADGVASMIPADALAEVLP